MTPQPPTTNNPAPADPGTLNREAAEAVAGPINRWAIHRRMYDWVLSLADTKHATWSLFVLAFAESSFFPIPPDVLLGPLCLGKRVRSLWFASVSTLGSVMGAVLGYAIGFFAWETVSTWVFTYVPGFSQKEFDLVQVWYDHWGVWVLFAAAFTPIPFKVFTIAGGVFGQPLLPFIVVSTIGRGARFFLVAGVFWWIGPKAVPFIDKYFNLLCIVFMALLVGGVILIKLL